MVMEIKWVDIRAGLVAPRLSRLAADRITGKPSGLRQAEAWTQRRAPSSDGTPTGSTTAGPTRGGGSVSSRPGAVT